MKLTTYVLATLVGSTTACLHHLQTRSEAPSTRAREPSPLSKTALTNVRVFNGHFMSKPTTIVIDGDRISDCTDSVTNTIDATGKFLIPGLIESHAHPTGIDSLEAFASYGVTTVMNMGCRNYTACAPLRNQPGLTDYHTAGVPAVGPNSSHAIGMKIPDSQLIFPNSDPVQLVDWVFGNGSDYMKITVETNGPTQEQQNRMVDAAHALGKQTMSHASDMKSFLQAIVSQTDGLQHVPSDGNLTSHDLKTIRRQNQYVTPTLAIIKYGTLNPAVALLLKGKVGVFPMDSWYTVEANVAALHRMNIPILAGTDAVGTIAGTNVSLPFGKTLHQELEYMVGVGMKPAQALKAATSVPAKWQNMPDRGHVKVGMRADLILLGSDPLKDIKNTRDIVKVWVAGREYLDVAKPE
jgi:imidazolonepropionase-like amidohydrolase